VLSYRVILDVPVEVTLYLAELLRAHRGEIGTRRGTRALSCRRQAVFALAWFRDRPDVARLGKGFRISQATAYRYLTEATGVLAARAPDLRQALEKAKEQGLPYLILDGKIVASDRCKENLQRVMVSPSRIGDLTTAALVLVHFEHKMIA
jgi:hypothetical protein